MTRAERWNHLVERFESFTDLQRRDLDEGEWDDAINKMYGWILGVSEFNPDLEDDISNLWTETYNREFKQRYMK